MKKTYCWLALVPAFLLFLLPLAAEEEHALEESGSSSLLPEDALTDEDVITVTAVKIEENLAKTTEHVEVITRRMLEQSGGHTLNEVLNAVPGLSFIGKTVGNSEPLQMNGFTDEYVKVLVDGVPVTTGSSSAIYSYISTDNVDHIEVIEGSSSAIWGSDAIAGVINIITKSPAEEKPFSGSISGEVRSDASVFSSSTVALQRGGFSASGRASYDYKAGESQEQVFTNPISGKSYDYDSYEVPEEKTWTAGASLGWKQDELFSLLFSSDYSRGESKDVSSTQHDDGYYQPFTASLSGQLKGDWQVRDDRRLSGYLSARRYESGTHNQNFSGSWHEPSSQEFLDFEGELCYTAELTDSQQLMAGINSLYSAYHDDTAESESEERYQSMNVSLFGQDSISVGNLVIVPGARAFLSIPIDRDHDEELIFNLSPKLSFRYEASERLSFKLSGGSGFKLPTLTQKYNEHYKGKGNPDLEPEISYSLNASSDWTPEQGLLFTVGGYATYLHNMIDAVDWYEADGSWGGRNYENYANVISTGANLKAEYRRESWHAWLGYSYLFMRQIVDGRFQELVEKISHQIKASVTYTLERTHTAFNLNAFWYAPRRRSTAYDYSGSGAEWTSDYLKVNLRIDQSLFNRHLTLYAGVKNLLDSFSFIKSDAGQTMKESFGSGDGIQFYLGAKYQW